MGGIQGPMLAYWLRSRLEVPSLQYPQCDSNGKKPRPARGRTRKARSERLEAEITNVYDDMDKRSAKIDNIQVTRPEHLQVYIAARHNPPSSTRQAGHQQITKSISPGSRSNFARVFRAGAREFQVGRGTCQGHRGDRHSLAGSKNCYSSDIFDASLVLDSALRK